MKVLAVVSIAAMFTPLAFLRNLDWVVMLVVGIPCAVVIAFAFRLLGYAACGRLGGAGAEPPGGSDLRGGRRKALNAVRGSLQKVNPKMKGCVRHEVPQERVH